MPDTIAIAGSTPFFRTHRVIAGVNMGRDTDCVTAVAGGIAGALTGGSSLPPTWIEQVDRVTKMNRYTNATRTFRETADGLYEALRERLRRMKSYAEVIEKA